LGPERKFAIKKEMGGKAFQNTREKKGRELRENRDHALKKEGIPNRTPIWGRIIKKGKVTGASPGGPGGKGGAGTSTPAIRKSGGGATGTAVIGIEGKGGQVWAPSS